jgi:nucleoside-diphosphate-sugar epimerase
MRVLVSGAGGFIGGHLTRALLDRGDDVRAADIKPLDEWIQVHPDATNYHGINLGLWDYARATAAGCDEIYHLAADAGGMGFISTHKAACTLNVLADTQMIRAAHKYGTRIWYASSGCVYPLHLQQTADAAPLREEDAYAGVDPEEAYGWEKLFAERMYLAHAADHGTAVRIGRYESVYGPWAVYRGGREKAPTALCRKIATAKLTGQDSVEVWGDGTAIRTWTYIDDAVAATLAITASDYGQPLNVGTDDPMSIGQLVSLIEQIAEYKVRRVWTDGPVGVPGARRSDNSRAAEVTGWKAQVSLREGLERTFAWVHDQVKAELA